MVTKTEQRALITGEKLAAMGDVGPCELVEGKIVEIRPASYRHGEVVGNISQALFLFVQTHQLGHIGMGRVGIYTHRDPDTVRGMDVYFISNERYAEQRTESYLDVAPELVVEVLSPNDSWSDVMQKLREYLAIGVKLVWIADPEAERIYAYRSVTDVQEFTREDTLTADPVLPDFSVPVHRLFKT